MKYILAQEPHFRSLFLHTKFTNGNPSDYGLSNREWQILIDENDNVFALLRNYEEHIQFEDGEGNRLQEDFFEVNKNIHHLNPPENSVIYMDRLLRENFFRQIYNQFGISWIKRLDEIYKEKNCTLILNWAYFEATDYECSEMYGLLTYKWDCKHIVLSDYVFFDNEKYSHINVDPIYSFWFHIYEHILFHEFDDLQIHIDTTEGDASYYDFINTILDGEPTDESKKYSFIVGNPGRFHRMYLLKKLIDSNLHKEGDITLKKEMYQEYYDNITSGRLIEGATTFTSIAKEYFSSKYFKPIEFYSDIEDRIGNNLNEYNFAHQTYNIKNKEYTRGYLDIYGDTHIMFQTGSPLFSEKVYHGLFYKKNFIVFGSNFFYKKLKEIGGYNFFEELGINEEEYLKDDNPIRQADIIYQRLSKLSKKDIIDIYNKTKEKREKNYELIFDYFYKITEPVREIILN